MAGGRGKWISRGVIGRARRRVEEQEKQVKVESEGQKEENMRASGRGRALRKSGELERRKKNNELSRS